jgi:hypothetical protein
MERKGNSFEMKSWPDDFALVLLLTAGKSYGMIKYYTLKVSPFITIKKAGRNGRVEVCNELSYFCNNSLKCIYLFQSSCHYFYQ